MHVVIFEGIRWDTFAPLAFSKPTFMLPCGMGTLLDKQLELLAPSRLSLWVRPHLAQYCQEQVIPSLKIPTTVNQPIDDEATLITTGRTLHFAKFEVPERTAVVLEEGGLVRFVARGKNGRTQARRRLVAHGALAAASGPAARNAAGTIRRACVGLSFMERRGAASPISSAGAAAPRRRPRVRGISFRRTMCACCKARSSARAA